MMKKQILLVSMCLCVLISCSCIATARAVSGFRDVDAAAYYADAVDWAVSEGITAGTTPTTFAPNRTCTEAEILTFLWRANASPESSVENPFPNISTDSYYYEPVRWAYANGMLTGSAFDPAKPCKRSAAVKYLWQAAGSPDTSTGVVFTDIPANSGYQEAVAWAVQNQITAGTGNTVFSPDGICTRAQIVTFLYRAENAAENGPASGEQETEDTEMPQLQIEIGEQFFTATLLDNPTTRALLEQLPLTVNMEELNGNEKYYYLQSPLPTDSQRPGSIETGDLMLYGSDCLVLFYQSFSSGYSYTRLGSVDDPSGLSAALGQGSAAVTFRIN